MRQRIYITLVIILAACWYYFLWRTWGQVNQGFIAFVFTNAFFLVFWMVVGILGSHADRKSIVGRKILGIFFFTVQALYVFTAPYSEINRYMLSLVMASWSGLFEIWVYRIINDH